MAERGSRGAPPLVRLPTDRIVVLDALRGVCFVVMTVDHLQGNPFSRFSNPYFGPLGFFTAVLGFVFLSGLVAGRVYERERTIAGTRSMVRRLLRRARALYVTQMVVFLSVVAAIELHLRGAPRWHIDLVDATPLRGIAFGTTLAYEPEYLGILPMYLLFLLMTPAVLWQFGKGHVGQVLAFSALLWVLSGLLIRLPADPSGVDFGAFNPIGYQFVFIAGLAFGTDRISIRRLPHRARNGLIASSAIVVAILLTLRWEYAFDGSLNPVLGSVSSGLSSEQLGPLRLLNFAAFCLVLYWVCDRVRWNEVHSVVFSWLAFVGRHSLPVFAWSILAAYATTALLPRDPSQMLGLVAVALLTISLTVPAALHAMVRSPRATPTSRRTSPSAYGEAGVVAPVDLVSTPSRVVP